MTQNYYNQSRFFYFLQPHVFPQLYYAGIIGALYAVVQVILGNFPQAAFVLILSVFIILLRSWTRLDIKNKTLTDFLLIIPYRKINIQHISGIRVVENVVNQTLNSRGSTSTISYDNYRLLLISDTESIVLKESKNKDHLLKNAGQIALAARVQLDDRTSDE